MGLLYYSLIFALSNFVSMCLNIRNIKSPSKLLSLDNSAPAILSVHCGQCSECIEAKCSEYLFRSYYQAQSCIDAGGYVYFDTLTYSDQFLPHLSDFASLLVEKGSDIDYPCFSRYHIRNFLKRLRINLSRKGYNPAGSLKYFLVTEYGADDRYTHRPHVHILFYNLDPELSPLVLSSSVHDAWPYGRTDGIPYQPIGYVYNHVYGRMSPCTFDDIVVRNVCNYVAKYVVKDSDFNKIVINRLSNLSRYCSYHVDFDDTEFTDVEDYVKFVKRQVSPFHLQSVGFGADFLRYNDIDDVNRTSCIKMPDAKKGVRTIHLPQYYKRKLWYDLYYIEGKPKWVLNADGVAHNRFYVKQNIANLAYKMQDWMSNLELYFGSDSYSDVHSYVSDLLGSRTWYDYASYLLLYRGRLLSRYDYDNWSSNHVQLPYNIDKQIDNIYKLYSTTDVIVNGYEGLSEHSTLYNLFNITPPDLVGNYIPYLSIDDRDEYFFNIRRVNYRYVIHDYHVENCSGFDELFNIYMYSKVDYNAQKDLSYFLTKKKLKDITNLLNLFKSHGLSIPSSSFAA